MNKKVQNFSSNLPKFVVFESFAKLQYFLAKSQFELENVPAGGRAAERLKS